MIYRIDEIEVLESNPFKNDKLERKPVVDFLTALIGRLDGPFVLALDSNFGTGKTTLVRILEKCLEKEGHRCINFNAWKVDYATDPLVALVASIDRIGLKLSDENKENQFKKHIKKLYKITTAVARTSGGNYIKVRTLGVFDIEAISSAFKSSESKTDRNRNLVAEFNEESELFNRFRDELEEAVKLLQNDDSEQQSKDSTGSNLVIFVDELDRCRPNFAVELLERIKHLFDISNIVFVLSIDKKQIEASIKAVYGPEFDATEYLRRFFNLEYGIPVPDTRNYIDSLISRFELNPIFDKRKSQHSQYERDKFIDYLNIFANATGLSLRAIERCVTRFRIVMDDISSNQYFDAVLLAFLIVLHSDQPEYYNQIIDGQVSPEDVIKNLTSLRGVKFHKRELNTLYAHLLSADPDGARVKKRMSELSAKRREDEEAESILQIVGSLPVTGRSRISLADIAKKIDLASWVG